MNSSGSKRRRHEPKNSKVQFSIAFCVFSMIVEVLIFTCLLSTHASAQESSSVPALTVTSTFPRKENWPIEITAYGSIAAWEEASIGARIGGYQLIEVFVNVGDRVKKGQVLARFDQALLLAEKKELQARADQANANQQRALTLQGRNAMSDQDTLHAITQSKIAEALLDRIQLQLEYTDVRAPDDGVISARFATLGATATVGQELFRLIRQERLEWRGELDAINLSEVKAGQSILLQLPDGSPAHATVRKTSPALDINTRLAIIYADLHPNDHAKAGMYVSGRIQVGQSSALTLPAKSVIIRDGNSYVLTLLGQNETTKVSLREVEVGRRHKENIEIKSGIDENESVVNSGAGFLSDGDLVRVTQ